MMKRDKLYRNTLIATGVFAFLSFILMFIFKSNEVFWEVHSLATPTWESSNEGAVLSARHSMDVNFKSEHQSKLVIPLSYKIADNQVTLREEFTQDKLVVTLHEAADCIDENATIITDTSYMKAVGVYKHNSDIVVEIYCNGPYEYTMTKENDSLEINFEQLRSVYDKISVVYVAYESRSRLLAAEWQEELYETARQHNMKLYLSYGMQEKYTQEDIVLFANRVRADALIGIAFSNDNSSKKMTAVCNSTYFIPDFGSVQLAGMLAQIFGNETKLPLAEIRECNDDESIVKDAIVPSAMIVLDGIEDSFSLDIMTALCRTLDQITQQNSMQKP